MTLTFAYRSFKGHANHSPVNISETIKDRDSVPKERQSEMACGIERSSCDPDTLRAQYLENSLRCYQQSLIARWSAVRQCDRPCSRQLGFLLV